MSELTHAGWCIPKGRAWLTPQMAYQWMPEPNDIAAAMFEALGQDEESRRLMSQAAAAFALNEYDIRVVRDQYWEPLVHELAELVSTPRILEEATV
mgnify:CR=1 FL=1